MPNILSIEIIQMISCSCNKLRNIQQGYFNLILILNLTLVPIRLLPATVQQC